MPELSVQEAVLIVQLAVCAPEIITLVGDTGPFGTAWLCVESRTGWVSFKLHHCHLTDTGHGSDNDRDIWKENSTNCHTLYLSFRPLETTTFLELLQRIQCPQFPTPLPFYNLFSAPRLEASIGQELCSVYLRTIQFFNMGWHQYYLITQIYWKNTMRSLQDNWEV